MRCARRGVRSCAHLPRSRSARLTAQFAALQARLDDNAEAWSVLGQAIESGELARRGVASVTLLRDEVAWLSWQVEGLRAGVAAFWERPGEPVPPALGGPPPRDRHLVALPDNATAAIARALLQGEAAS